MKIHKMMIIGILMLCLLDVVCATANLDATQLGSDGTNKTNSVLTVKPQLKEAPSGAKADLTKSAIQTVNTAVSFTPTLTTGNEVDNSKKIAVYLPDMTFQFLTGATTDATYDLYCTAMFFEYNLDYLNNSNIASKLTKSNYNLLIVPMSGMSDTAANAINNYLANGGCVWFLDDPSYLEDGTVKENRIKILGGTASSSYNTITKSSRINVDTTDDITNGLPSQFSPGDECNKWYFFRSLSGSGTISGFNYKVLMSNGDCAMLIKFENAATGARAIYSNPNMFISGGDCSYFDSVKATKLFLSTKAWLLNLGINYPSIQITYPNSDKQFTFTIDDVGAASGEPALVAPFFDMEKTIGVSPASVNTFFIMPSSSTEKTSLQNYASNGDTHSMHLHNGSIEWSASSTSVSTYNSYIKDAKALVNKVMGVSDYGFTSWRFPYTRYCLNSQKAVAASGILIESSNGHYTNGVDIGNTADNNVFFPKQMLLDSKKTNIIELESTSIYDCDAENANDFYQKQIQNYPNFKNVNFPAVFVVGAHYQGIMTDSSLRNAAGQVLSDSKTTGTMYTTFSSLSKYMSSLRNARITASTSGNTTTVTVVTAEPITDFTIKAATEKVSTATFDGSPILAKKDILTNSSYIVKTIDAGTHVFTISSSSNPPTSVLPIANFSSNVTSGYAPLSVKFTDNSTNATKVSWDFDNNGVIDSTDRNPVYLYQTPNTYTVNLTASNEKGTNSKLATITVQKRLVLPIANFSSNVTSGYAPLSVKFIDNSTDATKVSWDFDNNGVIDSTDRNPVYLYQTPNTYTVKLTASNEKGKNSKRATITVSTKPPVASFTASKTSGRSPLTVSFTDTSTGTVSSRKWDFGDGKTSTSKSVSHVYTRGTYTCILTVKNSGGSSTASKKITVSR